MTSLQIGLNKRDNEMSIPLSAEECQTILNTILQHGLSIRQVPWTVTHLLHEIQYHVPGNDIVRQALNVPPDRYEWLKKRNQDTNGNFEFDDSTKTVTRVYTREVKIPRHAGHWMCQKVEGTASTVTWSSKHHNLAPTLKESIELYLRQLPKDNDETL